MGFLEIRALLFGVCFRTPEFRKLPCNKTGAHKFCRVCVMDSPTSPFSTTTLRSGLALQTSVWGIYFQGVGGAFLTSSWGAHVCDRQPSPEVEPHGTSSATSPERSCAQTYCANPRAKGLSPKGSSRRIWSTYILQTITTIPKLKGRYSMVGCFGPFGEYDFTGMWLFAWEHTRCTLLPLTETVSVRGGCSTCVC